MLEFTDMAFLILKKEAIVIEIVPLLFEIGHCSAFIIIVAFLVSLFS